MTDIVKCMIRVRSGYIIGHKDRPDQFEVEQEAMRAALMWLADNVSDEMVQQFIKVWEAEGGTLSPALSAAIRAAAGGEGLAQPDAAQTPAGELVCEWTDLGPEWSSSCKARFGAFASTKGRFFCPSCGKPIAFKSEGG